MTFWNNVGDPSYLIPNAFVRLSTTRLVQKMFAMRYTRGSANAEEPRDALRQLKYYGRFLT